MKLKERIQKIEDDFNLRKKYPHVFTNGFKWALRVVFIVWALLWITFFIVGGYKLSHYFAECPDNSKDVCLNPFYEQDKYMSEKVKVEVCQNYLCSKEYLLPGEVVGVKPRLVWSGDYDIAFIIFIVLMFVFQIKTRGKDGRTN